LARSSAYTYIHTYIYIYIEKLYEHLVLNETTKPDGSIVYLGMKIKQWEKNGPLLVGVNDKEDELRMELIRYPQATSAVPSHQIKGVMMSQLVRYRLICNNVKDFKASTRRLIGRIVKQGHSWRCLQRVWAKFIQKYWDRASIRRLRLASWFREVGKETETTRKSQVNDSHRVANGLVCV